MTCAAFSVLVIVSIAARQIFFFKSAFESDTFTFGSFLDKIVLNSVAEPHHFHTALDPASERKNDAATAPTSEYRL
jgi:hypothetical protein